MRALRPRIGVLGAVITAAAVFVGPLPASATPTDSDATPDTTTDATTDVDAPPAEGMDDTPDAVDDEDDEPVGPQTKPPRLDGPYIGGMLLTGVGLTRLTGLETGAFTTFGGSLRFGQMVLPWLGLGLSLGGLGGVRSAEARQQLGQGQLAVEATFAPLAERRIPLSLRAAFGFGGGAVTEEGTSGRSGYGGAMFSTAIGYTFFPWAAKKRPYKGGGFGLGPELGWIGFTPTAAGNPMSNTIYLALTATFFFGS